MVNQASLTGESVPVRKVPDSVVMPELLSRKARLRSASEK